jgi:hypothetical protein
VKRKPARQQHDLDRHDRHRVPRHLAEQGEHDSGEDVAAAGAATRQDRRTSALHVRRVDRIAGGLQRKVRLDRRAQVEFAAVEQRPAAMLGLGGLEIARDAPFEIRLGRAEIMLQEDVFGRDCRIGLQLEHPVAVLALQ